MNRGVPSLLLGLFSVVIFTFAIPQSVQAFTRDWDQQELGDPSQLRAVLDVLEQQKKSKTPPLNIDSQINFVQGVLFYHLGRYSESLPLFESAVRDQFVLEDYANYFLGLSHLRANNLVEATKVFSRVANSKESGPRKLSARYRLGEIALLEKKFGLAQQHFKFLERSARSTEKYPYILWNLAKLHTMERNSHKACIYARKLYSKHPAHELLSQWSLDLKNAEIDSLKPGCLASLNDQKTRIRNLQYAGESDRAKKEIQSLYTRSDSETKYYVDVIFARFLIDDGDVDDALKLLLPYYDQKSGDIAYLMLLAKAASRKGDVALAVSAYLKVHNMKPRSGVGRESLFQAAFTSYLNQDYDGALTRFSDYKKKYGGKNGIAAGWYTAWIKYLKGDFKGAYDGFDEFSKMRMSRRMRKQYVDTTRINYWKAVSLVKMGQAQAGLKLLEKISLDPSVGFYAIAAKARVATLKEEIKSRQIASLEEKTSQVKSKLDLSPLSLVGPTGETTVAESATMETEAEIIEEVKETQGETADSAEADAEGESDTDVGAEDAVAEGEVPVDEQVDQGVEEIVATLKDPRLQKWFQKAETLRNLGFVDWSNRELQYIEAKTRNKTYLQTLIEKYEAGNAYYRSSYIAEVYYENERRKGLNPSNSSWKKTYPQAFDKIVSQSSDEFGIPEAVIWGIMRTESFFRPAVKSNVGALGLMQVMPLTGQKMAEMIDMSGFRPQQLLDPKVNVRVGTKYLQRLSKMFDGSLPLIAAGYNAGPHRVYSWLKSFGNLSLDEFIEHIPFNQTRGYAKKVIRSYFIYSSLYEPESIRKSGMKWLSEAPKITYTGPAPTKETWEPL